MSKNKIENTTTQEMLEFIQKSPCCFHAVSNVSKKLLQEGFIHLQENKKWNLEEGKKYFVTRNSSSIISFYFAKKFFEGFLISASHGDSPCFKIKENSAIVCKEGYVKLNVEKYGGMLCAPWFDRPLSAAGRIICNHSSYNKTVNIVEHLVNIERDLLMIPNLAIHLDKDANKKAGFNIQNDMLPVFSCSSKNNDILKTAAEYAGISEKDILSYDLYLYNREKGIFWGADNEFISSPRLDDLECVFLTLKAFLEAKNHEYLPVYCVFDNEEVGSTTRQGAASPFLRDTLKRINFACGRNDEDFLISLANSFMISADNAHAVHPNYAHESDPVNAPVINGGPVIKFNASQKYTSDAISAALFKTICSQAGIPYQIFTNRSDKAGGSTLGNISTAQVPINTVDIGIAQWAMHSPYESAGSKDPNLFYEAIKKYYNIDWKFMEEI